MYKKIILILTVGITSIMATAPAKPGEVASERVIQMTQVMAESHGQGGFAQKIQRVKQRNLELPIHSLRDLREDVYGSFPVILGSYSDSNDPAGTATALQAELFDGPWSTITMAEHYEEMSYGQFHLSGSVYGWYELSQTGFVYGGTDNGWDGGVSQFLTETLDLADLEIDFTQYDNDGDDGIPNSGDDDGIADVVFFVHSGTGGETGAAAIWSHSWRYSGAVDGNDNGFVTDDIGFDGNPILVDDYIMQPAENGDGSLIEIGVFSHEFGHALGLPDLYDTDYSSDGIGNWCLMAGGSWTTASSPAHMSAWCKEMLGWVIPVVLDSNAIAVDIPPVVETGYVLKLWTAGEFDPWESRFAQELEVGREYFLIENRQIQGTDQHLEGTGLLIYHVDNSQWSNSNDDHRLVDLEPANGQEGGTNPGQPWSASSENQFFDFHTDPSSMDYSGNNTEVAVFNFVQGDTSIFASVEIVEAFPHLYIEHMNYTDENDDGFLSPSESGSIWIELINYGVLTTGIYASVIDDNPAFTFTAPEMTFDDLEVNASVIANSPLEFTMATDFESGTVPMRIAVGNATSETIDTLTFELRIGDPQVALIDADGALSGDSNVQEYYSQALIDNDIVFAIWDILQLGLPDSDWLQAKPQVVWFTGNSESPLTQSVIDLLSAYQDNGGRLLLSGQDITDGDETQAAFLSDYCAAVLDEETTTNPRYAFGNPDHEIMEASDQFRINTHFGANNQTSPDVVTSMSHGKTLFQYPRLDYRSAGTTTIQNGYKTIFLAFGFEAIASLEDEGPTIRADLMQRFLEWFDIDYVGIDGENVAHDLTPGISHFYPNPFNPTINIGYVLPERVELTLTVYDIAGREVARLVKGEQPAGNHDIQWNGLDGSGNSVSTGVYFCRLEAGAISQTIKMVYLK